MGNMYTNHEWADRTHGEAKRRLKEPLDEGRKNLALKQTQHSKWCGIWLITIAWKMHGNGEAVTDFLFWAQLSADGDCGLTDPKRPLLNGWKLWPTRRHITWNITFALKRSHQSSFICFQIVILVLLSGLWKYWGGFEEQICQLGVNWATQVPAGLQSQTSASGNWIRIFIGWYWSWSFKPLATWWGDCSLEKAWC